jgi:hypothetical protein
MKKKFVIWLSIFLSLSLLAVFSLSAASNEKARSEVQEIRTTTPGTHSGVELQRTLVYATEQNNEKIVLYLLHQEQLKEKQSTKIYSKVGSHRGYSTAKECVSMVEHGGSYDESSNPTHKGRYQFSRPAWIYFGGVPEHWDNWELATPEEQDRVFENAWSQGPAVQKQQWLNWDGCGPPDGS